MQKKYIIILILSTIALINALYLSTKAYQLLHPVSGAIISSGCDINDTFSCTNVITHPLTMIGGIPFPYLALMVYPLIMGLAIWGVSSRESTAAHYIRWISLGGIVFNGYIISQEVRFIHAYCLLCLICAGIIVTIHMITWAMKNPKPTP